MAYSHLLVPINTSDVYFRTVYSYPAWLVRSDMGNGNLKTNALSVLRYT